ncbi:unnamed protein product, partial [Discosporangium mesarthrocarpum]
HHLTGEPPPPELLDDLFTSKTLFSGIETQTQILYALLDQELFGAQVAWCS